MPQLEKIAADREAKKSKSSNKVKTAPVFGEIIKKLQVTLTNKTKNKGDAEGQKFEQNLKQTNLLGMKCTVLTILSYPIPTFLSFSILRCSFLHASPLWNTILSLAL